MYNDKNVLFKVINLVFSCGGLSRWVFECVVWCIIKVKVIFVYDFFRFCCKVIEIVLLVINVIIIDGRVWGVDSIVLVIFFLNVDKFVLNVMICSIRGYKKIGIDKWCVNVVLIVYWCGCEVVGSLLVSGWVLDGLYMG